jgi:hypothetical protein
VERATLATANTDHSLSTRGLSQFLHTTSTAEEATILSNFVPQSRHLYSNSGILASALEYSQTRRAFQSGRLAWVA